MNKSRDDRGRMIHATMPPLAWELDPEKKPKYSKFLKSKARFYLALYWI
ncbi:MAG: hypothetical protein ACRYE8_07115 [Janthinobacterium lividum]